VAGTSILKTALVQHFAPAPPSSTTDSTRRRQETVYLTEAGITEHHVEPQTGEPRNPIISGPSATCMDGLEVETKASLANCQEQLVNISKEIREMGKSHYTTTSDLRQQHINHLDNKEDEWTTFQAQQQMDNKALLDEQHEVCLIKIKAEKDDHETTRETARLRLEQEMNNTASISAASVRHLSIFEEDTAQIRKYCQEEKFTLQEQLSVAERLNLEYESEVQRLEKKLQCQNHTSTPDPAIDTTPRPEVTSPPTTLLPTPSTEEPAFIPDTAVGVSTSPPTTLLPTPSTEEPAFIPDTAVEASTMLVDKSTTTTSKPTRDPASEETTLLAPRPTTKLPTEPTTTKNIIANNFPINDVPKTINEIPNSAPRLQRDLTIETHPSSVPNDALQCVARNSLVMAVLVTLTLLGTISLIYNIKNCILFYKSLWFPPPPPTSN
jgi:viroplasmin and RNaseH domain-containing protein